MTEPSARARKRTPRGQRTESELLDAAESHFARFGFRGAKVREIAESAGIRDASIYGHFGGKLHLYEAVLARAFAPASQALDQAVDVATGSPNRLLPELMADMVIERPSMGRLILHELLTGELTDPMRSWLSKLMHQGIEAWTRIIGREANDADRLAQLALFDIIIGYSLSPVLFPLLEGDDDPLSAANQARQKALIRTIAARVADADSLTP